jgi:hypothetical protein
MATKKQLPSRTRPLFKVGDHVRFHYVNRFIDGVIVEDRGNLGLKGRRVYGIQFPGYDLNEPRYIEMQEDEIAAVSQSGDGNGRSHK